jgi:pilus assembly protein Flp/PilA
MVDYKDNKEEEGATLVEYALLVALIAIIAIAALKFLGEAVSNEFSEIGSQFENAG